MLQGCPLVSVLTACGPAQIVKERQQFQRVVVTRDEAMSMFQEPPFKIEILSGLPQEATITLYRRAAHASQLSFASFHDQAIALQAALGLRQQTHIGRATLLLSL